MLQNDTIILQVDYKLFRFECFSYTTPNVKVLDLEACLSVSLVSRVVHETMTQLYSIELSLTVIY